MNCSKCDQEIQKPNGVGTGYATDAKTGNLVCYMCCAEIDKEQMRKNEKITLFLARAKQSREWLLGEKVYEVTNWPGTLVIEISAMKNGAHNFGGRASRRDVWFAFEGEKWHGINIGNSEILHCKKLKGKGCRLNITPGSFRHGSRVELVMGTKSKGTVVGSRDKKLLVQFDHGGIEALSAKLFKEI